METKVKDYQEIDVVHLINKIWNSKFKVLFSGLLVALAALAFSIFLVKPQYESATKIYVVNKNSDEGNISAQELQAGNYLVNDYKEIILSQSVMDGVVKAEAMNILPQELKEKIKVDIPTDTRVITITVTDEDPERAAELANTVREVASDKIMEVTDVKEVNSFEEAEAATEPSTPRLKRNAALGFLAGAFLTVVLILVKEVLDDRIRRPEDVEEILQMTLLGIIPDVNKMK